MGQYIKSFICGYSNILELFPDYSTNNQETDWKVIGIDIKVSMQNYYERKEIDKVWLKKKRVKKNKKLK